MITWVLAELFLDSDVNLVKQALISSLFVVPEFLLITGLIAVLSNNVTIKLEMEHHMLNNIVSLEVTILV